MSPDSHGHFTNRLYWGSDHVQWSGMRGQEWGIEISFRLRIMDHLLNRFPSLCRVCVLSHIWNPYICWEFAYILNIIWNILTVSSEKPSIHPDEKQLSDQWEKHLGDIMNPSLWGNMSPVGREPKNPNAIWIPERIPTKPAIWEAFDHPEYPFPNQPELLIERYLKPRENVSRVLFWR